MAAFSFQKLSGTAKALLLTGVMGSLVLASYYFLLHSDLSDAIQRDKGRGVALQQELTQQEGARASYLNDKQRLLLLQQKQKEMNKALPETTDPASFLSALQNVSNVSGVEFKGWKTMDEKSDVYFARVPFQLELTGKFHQIAKFVYEVGRVDRIINVENLEVGDAKIEGDEVKLKAKCLATSFRLVQKSTTPTKAAGVK